MPWKWYTGKIKKVKDESPTTKRFWLEVDEVEHFEFKAGQFITLDLPIHEKRLKRWRSYSIASAPDGTNELELCVVKLEGGLGSTYLFEKADIGTEVKFKGPAGAFVLPEQLNHRLVFICTGTGIAPFRSMILDLYQKGQTDVHLHLIFGTRFERGILYREEMERWQEAFPHFKFDVALSREKVEGYTYGYVHKIYQNQYAIVNSTTDFYLCGWSNMVDEAAERLQGMGYAEGQIHLELYG